MKRWLQKADHLYLAFLKVFYPPEHYHSHITWTVPFQSTTAVVEYHYEALPDIQHRLLLNGQPIYEHTSKWIGRTLPFTIPFELQDAPCLCHVYKGAQEVTADLYVNGAPVEKVDQLA